MAFLLPFPDTRPDTPPHTSRSRCNGVRPIPATRAAAKNRRRRAFCGLGPCQQLLFVVFRCFLRCVVLRRLLRALADGSLLQHFFLLAGQNLDSLSYQLLLKGFLLLDQSI